MKDEITYIIIIHRRQTAILQNPWYTKVYRCAVTLPNYLTTIRENTFYNCTSLVSVTLPHSLTTIEEYAFYNCSGLTSVTLPNSLSTIAKYVFNNCSGLTTLTLPKSLNSIGYGAFEGCSSLEKISNERQVPIKCNPRFADNVLRDAVLYVPTGTLAEYEKVDPWRNFWNIKEMEFSGIEDIKAVDDSFSISSKDGVLTIEGINDFEEIAIFDLQGRCVYSGIGRRIDNITSGIYLLKSGNRTLKFGI